MEHWHTSVIENGYYTDRKKCFRTKDQHDTVSHRQAGIGWLLNEIDADQAAYGLHDSDVFQKYEETKESLYECEEADVMGDWEGAITVPPFFNDQKEVVMGYRLMSVDGACEEMI
jgi:hypothetical protein